MAILWGNKLVLLLAGLFVMELAPAFAETTQDIIESGEMLGKKLLSYPTLVSILKARNSSRPGIPSPMAPQLSQLSNLAGAQLQPISSSHSQSNMPSPLALLSANSLALQSKPQKLCAPASQDKSGHIAGLCSGRRGGNGAADDQTTSKCMERYCVSVIPDDDDDFDNGFGNEIVAFTDCDVVKSLFKILTKSSANPKCYDCSS